MEMTEDPTSRTTKHDSQVRELRQKLERRLGKKVTAYIGILLIVILLAFGLIRAYTNHEHEATAEDPFSSKLIQSTKFTLYYPTNLPTGYSMNNASIQQPANGVVVLDMKDSRGDNLFLSEEVRPDKFDIGGFFKGFSDLQQYPISDGSIAIGRIENGALVVGSLVNNNVWIIGNTKAHISLDQMKSLFQSLVSTSGDKP